MNNDTLSIAKKEYSIADQASRKILEKIFGADAFKFDWKSIKTVQDAYEANGVTADDVLPYKNPSSPLQEWHNALAEMAQVCQALNQGWTPDWSNSSQAKWRPWFQYGSSGFRFGDSSYGNVATLSAGGSRLLLETEEKSDYCGKQFIELWNKILK